MKENISLATMVLQQQLGGPFSHLTEHVPQVGCTDGCR